MNPEMVIQELNSAIQKAEALLEHGGQVWWSGSNG